MRNLCRRLSASLVLLEILPSFFPTPTLAEEVISPPPPLAITEEAPAEATLPAPPPILEPAPPSMPAPTQATSSSETVTPIQDPVAATTTESLPISPPPNPAPSTPTSVEPEIRYVYLPCAATTSTEPPTQTSATSSTVTAPAPEPPTPIAPTPPPPAVTSEPPPRIALNELNPAPTTGDEWIELASDQPFTVAQLEGWSINDSAHALFRFRPDTWPEVRQSPDGRFLFVTWKSASLNNTGDTVLLKDAHDNVIDQWTYTKTAKDQVWTRTPDLTGPWTSQTTATPLAPNPQPLSAVISITTLVAAEPQPPVSPSSTPVARALPTTKPLTKPANAAPKTMTPTKSAPKQTPQAIKVPTKVVTPKKSVAKPKPKAAPKPKAPAKPKTTKLSTPPRPNPAPTPPLLSTSIPMLDTLGTSVRVTLTGIAGSIHGLLGTHQFVLQTEDGRGLLVRGNGKQPSPPFGTLVRVTGTLTTNDSGTSLRLMALDRWTQDASGTQTIATRTVDLLAPAYEDAWSLIEVTGTVRSVKATSVILDVDDLDVPVQIRPAIRYRSERLKPGDTVRIRGLLDTRTDIPRLIPRSADDIIIVKAATAAKVATTAKPLPDWLPFGAAGVTVALAEGYKRVKKIHARRKLEQFLLETTPSILQIDRTQR